MLNSINFLFEQTRRLFFLHLITPTVRDDLIEGETFPLSRIHVCPKNKQSQIFSFSSPILRGLELTVESYGFDSFSSNTLEHF
jgi:hypothetical protein